MEKLADVPSVKSEFDNPQSDDFSDAVAFLEREPPLKQVVRDNNLTWEPAPVGQNTRAKNIFVCVRRVRNNLFHGGKFEDTFRLNQRDRQLLESSLIILQRCTEVDEMLGKKYVFMGNPE